MTYNWNNMVSITVPTGTNGWLYSGELTINGVKVRFPVGVPTSVPEPAAVLLKKMIELEQKEDANTAKPQNHYVGDVTIPAGKTLTLEAGAKFVDNSGPSEVVILPETELEKDDFFGTATPLSATPTEGATAVVTYNGVAYESPVARVVDEGVEMFVAGNTELIGIPGGNADAPFTVILMPAAPDGATVVFTPTDDPTSVTISIVQVGAASGGESDGGGVFTVHATVGSDWTTVTTDKTVSEVMTAIKAGHHCEAKCSIPGNFYIYLPLAGDTISGQASPDDSNALMFSALVNMGANTIYTLTMQYDGTTTYKANQI